MLMSVRLGRGRLTTSTALLVLYVTSDWFLTEVRSKQQAEQCERLACGSYDTEGVSGARCGVL